MGKYVFAYKGGGMAADRGGAQRGDGRLERLVRELGDAVVEIGNPFGASRSIGRRTARTAAAAR